MFFMLPIRTNIRPWRSPYVNYGIIIANVVIFSLSYWPHHDQFGPQLLRPWAEQFVLNSSRPRLWQFVSYAFLHGGFLHIGGNMFFLYLFGKNVNDKLGHIGYLCFYLAGAVFSGVGHVLVGGGDVLGASGAIAAVTGAYLVLFPKTLVTVFYWLFIFINTVDIPAFYFIGLKLIFWDNLAERSMPDVAYDAHLSGYAFGILAMMGMLATGLLSSSGFDLWSMVKQWNRQRHYRDVVASGYDPFSGPAPRRYVTVKEIEETPAQRQLKEEIRKLREQIATQMSRRNLPAAAQLYLNLVQLDSGQVLPRQYLLDIANQLASEKRYSEAAGAYEKLLAHYKTSEHIEQVELMLGILYARYLNDRKLAKLHLQNAVERLADSGQLNMCKEELTRLES